MAAREQLQEIRDTGLLDRVVADLGLGIGDGALDLSFDDLGRIAQKDGAERRGLGLGHLAGGLLEIHDPGGDGRDGGIGDDEGVSVAVVEPDGDVAG